MGKLTIIADKPIFPIRTPVKAKKDKDSKDDENVSTEQVKLGHVYEKGTNFDMTLEVTEDTVLINMIKASDDKKEKPELKWGYNIEKSRVILTEVEQYPAESTRSGFSKITVYISTAPAVL
jgi:hypothetical protein